MKWAVLALPISIILIAIVIAIVVVVARKLIRYSASLKNGDAKHPDQNKRDKELNKTILQDL